MKLAAACSNSTYQRAQVLVPEIILRNDNALSALGKEVTQTFFDKCFICFLLILFKRKVVINYEDRIHIYWIFP